MSPTKARRRAPPQGEEPQKAPPGGIPLGSTGRTHPPLGLGLWALGRWSADDEVRTRTALVRAIERGVRWIDTAEVYGTGRSERLLADTLADLRERPKDLFVTTKVSWEHLRPSQVRAALTASLRRLGRSSVDLYLVHAPDRRVPIQETMGALEALWKEGKIGAIGVSNFTTEELESARSALSETEIVANQVRYNLFDREDGDAVVDYCRKNGIVLEAYTPLLRGLLTGRYLDGETPPKEVRRFTRRLLEDEKLPDLIARARGLRELARSRGLPMASIALHWLRRRGAAPVFGASGADQVDAIADAWARVPDDDVLDRAERIVGGELDA